ncbi:M56 family metallopeptidase [Terriglobus sp. TAA 43]|uniref:M56 family metallopeptidase n=1 Tax=Terriglobus sp. TAA 43 TaxID=278961 RepID=UPI00068D733A|nr:M56 family metallopeptidase [Terriglobus sp. TAA 43]
MSNSHLFLLLPAIGNHLWQSTAFACAVWLITLTLRHNAARLRYGLWIAASLKFLLPLSLLLNFGALMAGPRKISVPQHQFAYSVATTAMHPLHADTLQVKEMPDRGSGPAPLYATIATIWFCGCVCVLSVWLMRWRQLRETLDDGVQVDEGREYQSLRDVGGDIFLHRSWAVREPGVYGIFSPVLLWPEGLSSRLDDEHLAAIMLHEVTHVRHRDNLIATLHLVVEAVFWFHPFVWWIERNLLIERESVCDETVVHRLGNAEAYALSLLKVCRFRIEHEQSLVASAGGADLGERVVRIVTHRVAKLSPVRSLMLIVFGIVTLVIPLALGVLHPLPVYGQVLYREGALPSFEVVSVKLRPDGPPLTPAPQSGSSVHLFFTTKMLIMYAYNLPDFSEAQIAKGPGWTDDTYDIEGKFSDSDYAVIQKMSVAERQEQIQLRLQSVLKERFHLAAHLEKREQTIYALEVAKSGPKLSSARHQEPDRFGITHSGMDYELKVTGTDLDRLASLLGREPEVGGRSIVNRTGLSGSYDLTLHWTRMASSGPDPESTAAEGNAPSYFTAIQEQLGLRLVPAKGMVDSIVVDHIERPLIN